MGAMTSNYGRGVAKKVKGKLFEPPITKEENQDKGFRKGMSGKLKERLTNLNK